MLVIAASAGGTSIATASSDAAGNSIAAVVASPIAYSSLDSSGNVLQPVLPGGFALNSISPAGTQLVVGVVAPGFGGATGEGEGTLDGEGEGAVSVPHSADWTNDFTFDLSEVLRLIQFYNAGEFSCAGAEGEFSEDGFQPGSGGRACASHDSDYAPQDWQVGLSELLRMIQLYNLDGYVSCGGASEDGVCAAP